MAGNDEGLGWRWDGASLNDMVFSVMKTPGPNMRDYLIFALAAGADPDGRNDMGMSSLFFASDSNNQEAVEILLGFGADVNLPGNGPATVLMNASMRGRVALVNRFLTAGADVGAVDLNGHTALSFASMFNVGSGGAVVKSLVSAGADVGAGNMHGLTPLMIAAQNGCESAFEELLASGADVLEKNQAGQGLVDFTVAWLMGRAKMLIAMAEREELAKMEECSVFQHDGGMTESV